MWINRWSMIGKTRINHVDVPLGYVLDRIAFTDSLGPRTDVYGARYDSGVYVSIYSQHLLKRNCNGICKSKCWEGRLAHIEVSLLVFGLVQADLHKPKQRWSLKLREITSCSRSSQLRQSSTGSADVGNHLRQIPLCLLKEEDWFSTAKWSTSIFIW